MVLESNAMFEIVFEDSILATERLDESPIGSGTAVAPMLMFDVAHPMERPGGVFGRWQPFTALRMRHCVVVYSVVYVLVKVEEPDVTVVTPVLVVTVVCVVV